MNDMTTKMIALAADREILFVALRNLQAPFGPMIERQAPALYDAMRRALDRVCCPDCEGQGGRFAPCPYCHGSGLRSLGLDLDTIDEAGRQADVAGQTEKDLDRGGEQ